MLRGMDDVAELHSLHRDWLRDGAEPGEIYALREVPLEVGEEPEEGVEFEVVPCLGGVPPWA